MTTKRIIETVFLDEETGITIFEDVRGDFHISSGQVYIPGNTDDRYYLQSIVRGGWANTDTFQRIPNYFNSGTFLDYIIPANCIYNIGFILAAQSGNSVSTIGLFVDNVIKATAPLKDNIFYALYDPLAVLTGKAISIRFMPAGKGIDLSICVGGHLKNI